MVDDVAKNWPNFIAPDANSIYIVSRFLFADDTMVFVMVFYLMLFHDHLSMIFGFAMSRNSVVICSLVIRFFCINECVSTIDKRFTHRISKVEA